MTPDQFLSGFARFGIHLGLERIEQLLEDLGNPQKKVPIVHVAGTNGKGSVCAYVSSILQAAGYRVGRYTSPHLVDWRERICINSKWIIKDDLLDALIQVQRVIRPDLMPTQFEVITAAAWWYFAHTGVDIAVIETGLGGRLDATNVCSTPLASVITSISRDHWQRLGDSLEAIAAEKAGIIKPYCPVIVAELPLEAKAVIQAKALANHAPTTWVESAQKSELGAIWQGFEYPISLLGKHQLINSAIALATIQALQTQGWQISGDAVIQGMAQTQWLGRLQWAEYKSRKILIDGAHNVGAAVYLRDFVDENFCNHSKHWIIGMLDTKDHAGILRSLLRPKDSLAVIPVPAHQTVDPQHLVELAKNILDQPPQAYPDISSALDAISSDSDLVILCGSLYLIGEFLKLTAPFIPAKLE